MKATIRKALFFLSVLFITGAVFAQQKGQWILMAGGDFDISKSGIPGVSTYSKETTGNTKLQPGYFINSKLAAGPALVYNFTNSRTEASSGGGYYTFKSKRFSPGIWATFFHQVGKSKFYYTPSLVVTAGKFSNKSANRGSAVLPETVSTTEGNLVQGTINAVDFTYRLSNRFLLQAGILPVTYQSEKAERTEAGGAVSKLRNSVFGLDLQGRFYEVRVAVLF